MWDLVPNQIYTYLKELLDNIIHRVLLNARHNMWPGVHTVFQLIMLDLFCIEIIVQTLNAQVAKQFDTNTSRKAF